MPIKRWSRSPRSSAVEACRSIYSAAFSQPPYCEDPSCGELFVQRVKKYSQRPGFALDVATYEGLAVGFALSVVASPGDWWRDRVAEFLGPARATEWLGSACREIVHVAVAPEHQGHGHGKSLIDHLLGTASARTAVLELSSGRDRGSAPLSVGRLHGPRGELHHRARSTRILGHGRGVWGQRVTCPTSGFGAERPIQDHSPAR